MTPPTRLKRLTDERVARRLATAKDRVIRLLDATRTEAFEIVVIGSLAAGRFALHSDIDFLVQGSVDSAARVRAEQAVADAMRGAGIAYDLIFACDLTPARCAEFEHDLVEPSRLREENLARLRVFLPAFVDAPRTVERLLTSRADDSHPSG